MKRNTGKRYDESTKILAEQLRNDGLSVNKIADELGIAKSTIFQWVGHIGIEKKNKLKDIVCMNCEKVFKPRSSKTKYCSKECSNQRPVAQRSEHQSYKLGVPVQFRAGLSPYTGLRCSYDKNIHYIRVYLPDHPEANTRGYVYEHRVIAERMLGRKLLPNEIVHHKNRIRYDNREENLEVMDKYEHSLLHWKEWNESLSSR